MVYIRVRVWWIFVAAHYSLLCFPYYVHIYMPPLLCVVDSLLLYLIVYILMLVRNRLTASRFLKCPANFAYSWSSWLSWSALRRAPSPLCRWTRSRLWPYASLAGQAGSPAWSHCRIRATTWIWSEGMSKALPAESWLLDPCQLSWRF